MSEINKIDEQLRKASEIRKPLIDRIAEHIPDVLADRVTIEEVAKIEDADPKYVTRVVKAFHTKVLEADPLRLPEIVSSLGIEVSKKFALSTLTNMNKFGPIIDNMYDGVEKLQSVLVKKINKMAETAEAHPDNISLKDIKTAVDVSNAIKDLLTNVLAGPLARKGASIVVNNTLPPAPTGGGMASANVSMPTEDDVKKVEIGKTIEVVEVLNDADLQDMDHLL